MILDEIMEMFGDKNPDVNTLFKKQTKCCEKYQLSEDQVVSEESI